MEHKAMNQTEQAKLIERVRQILNNEGIHGTITKILALLQAFADAGVSLGVPFVSMPLSPAEAYTQAQIGAASAQPQSAPTGKLEAGQECWVPGTIITTNKESDDVLVSVCGERNSWFPRSSVLPAPPLASTGLREALQAFVDFHYVDRDGESCLYCGAKLIDYVLRHTDTCIFANAREALAAAGKPHEG